MLYPTKPPRYEYGVMIRSNVLKKKIIVEEDICMLENVIFKTVEV